MIKILRDHERPMTIGLIGFGSIGERHYKNLKKFFHSITVLTKRWDVRLPGIAHTWDEFAKRGPFDAIFITNETAKHISTIERCIPLKPKALFIEKPLSHTAKNAERVMQMLEKEKISSWVGYCLHFYRPLLRIKEILHTHILGKLYHLQVFAGQGLEQWRTRDYRNSYSAHRKNGGGVVLDLVHDINYPAWLLGEPLVFHSSIVKKLSRLAIDTEDYAHSIFSSPSGAMVTVTTDYLHTPGKRALEIVGEKGSLQWDSIQNALMISTKSGVRKEPIRVSLNDMYQRELEFFFGQLERGKFFTNMDEAIRDMRNVEKIKIGGVQLK